MIWWLRIRAAPAVLAALLVTLLVAVLVPRSEVPIPSVVGGLTSGLPLRYLVPLLPVLLLLHGQGQADRETERVAACAVRTLDVLFSLLIVGITLVASTVVPDGLAVARNIAGYLGFAYIVRWLSNARLAAVLTAFLPFVVVSVGGYGGTPAWWAWPLHDGNEPAAACAATLLLIGGLVVSPRPPLLGDRELED